MTANFLSGMHPEDGRTPKPSNINPILKGKKDIDISNFLYGMHPEDGRPHVKKGVFEDNGEHFDLDRFLAFTSPRKKVHNVINETSKKVEIITDHEALYKSLLTKKDFASAIGLCIVKIQTEVNRLRLIGQFVNLDPEVAFKTISTPEANKWRKRITKVKKIRAESIS